MTQAFIAMPFAREFHPVYQTIRAACEQLGIATIRIDEVWAQDDIYQNIEREILKADFIIADFTGDRMMEVPNPNVVHEAAFAKSNKKYILLMAQDHKCLPFDWRTRPAVIYQDSEEGLKYLQERLVLSIQALLRKEDFRTGQNRAIGPRFPAGAGVAATGSGPMEVMLNLLRSRQGQMAPIVPENGELPPGFRRDGEGAVCEIDESRMAKITPGKFSMGAEDDDDQQPIHEVHLTAYLIDLHPVTNAQYSKFIEAGGYHSPAYWDPQGWAWRCRDRIEAPEFFDDPKLNRPDHPAVGVSWYEAMAYSAWCNKHLPTEAEWEYAARGDTGRLYPWGNEKPNDKLANYKTSGPTPAGKFEPSQYGCYDMAGNVWQWCYDWYSPDYYAESLGYNPIGAGDGEERVCRGGAWTYDADTLLSYYRFSGPPALRDRGYGFRCARIL